MESGEKVVYNYFPEGKDSGGMLSIDKESGDIEINKIADNDSHSIYLHHAVGRVSEYQKEKKYLETDTVAWC